MQAAGGWLGVEEGGLGGGVGRKEGGGGRSGKQKARSVSRAAASSEMLQTAG